MLTYALSLALSATASISSSSSAVIDGTDAVSEMTLSSMMGPVW